ncbi:unnamed protein product, partial [Sphacelaria rigidula]
GGRRTPEAPNPYFGILPMTRWSPMPRNFGIGCQQQAQWHRWQLWRVGCQAADVCVPPSIEDREAERAPGGGEVRSMWAGATDGVEEGRVKVSIISSKGCQGDASGW